MNNLLNRLVLGSSATALLAAAPFGAAFAQGNGDIERVVVSASRITIAGYSQPTPVTVVGAAQIAQDGFANIADSVRDLPQVTAPPTTFSAGQASSSAGNVGSNLINLRNLTVVRTLVLFDGARVVASNLGTNQNSGVDTTTFPPALIQRVDIVTGGASAAWGSDAVAGVVNFVLDKNYNGFKATFQGSDTTDGLKRDVAFNGAWGGDIFGGRGHLEFAASANVSPDTVLLIQEKWFRQAYWVSNPAFVAGSSLPQLIVANNVGSAANTTGGLIVSSPAGVAGPGVVAAPANALRGIQFNAGGVPSVVNFGNVTLGSLSNGGSLTGTDSQQPYGTISGPQNVYTLFGYGRYKLTDTIQASVMLNYGYSTGKTSGAIAPQNVVVKTDNAYLPASVLSAMQNGGITSFTLGTTDTNNYNNVGATGARYTAQAESSLQPDTIFNRRNIGRIVGSLDGTLGDNWSWNAYVEYSSARLLTSFLGDPIGANLNAASDAVTITSANVGKSGLALGSIACRSSIPGQAAVAVSGVTAAAGCVPLDIIGTGVASPAAIGYIDGYSQNNTNYAHTSLNQVAAEASMQGTLPWELPAGKVAVAFGAGYRKEAAFVQTPPAQFVQGSFGNFPDRSYNVIEGFGEVDAPILKNNIVNSLDFTMAGRVTSYSTSGMVETWKLGATSQINDDIKLRTTWSVDIRAPNLIELFNQGTSAPQTNRDPKTQASVLETTTTTGNPNLVPEIARTISGGVVLTPTFLPGLTLSADWYNINISGEITAIANTTILAACNPQLPSPVNAGQNGNINDPLCSRLVFNGLNGALSNINLSVLNFASQRVSGLDLQSNYIMDFWQGTLAWSAVANLNDETTLNNPGTGLSDSAGSIIGNAPVGPKWKGILAATYNTGPYAVTVQGRWYGSAVTQQNANTGNQCLSAACANLYDPAHFEVPFSAFMDLRGNYKWNDNISFFGAVDNVLNNPPPLVAGTSAVTQPGQVGFYNTDHALYDMLGRAVRVGIRLNY